MVCQYPASARPIALKRQGAYITVFSVCGGDLCAGSSDHRQAARPDAQGECLIEARNIVLAQLDVRRLGILFDMHEARRLRDGEDRRVTSEKGERQLMQACVMRLGDIGEHIAAFAAARRKARMTEGTVGDDGDVMLLAPGDDAVLDGAFAQMVKHLVAGDLAAPGDRKRFGEILFVEIADPPG